MRLVFNPLPFLKLRLLFILAFYACSAHLIAQACSAPTNFEAVYYNHSKADYQWDYSSDALSYVLAIDVNNKSYSKTDLPGVASKASVKFAPPLKHNDLVQARLTKYCAGGGTKSASFDFIIIDDAIVYIPGPSQTNDPDVVEPVKYLNDNLVPPGNICGLCDPGFFRLESGFYGPFGIAVDSSIGPIEQLRFRKNELCTCLNDAIAAGILDANGGPGEHYTDKPFYCQITPYVFDKSDCLHEGREKNQERAAYSPGNSPNPLLLEAIPNPVSVKAVISYRLPMETNTLLTVHDVTGRLVHTLAGQSLAPAGDYQVEFDASELTSGFYFCTLQTADTRQTAVLVVAR